MIPDTGLNPGYRVPRGVEDELMGEKRATITGEQAKSAARVIAAIEHKGKTVDLAAANEAINRIAREAGAAPPYSVEHAELSVEMSVEKLSISLTGLFPVAKATIRMQVGEGKAPVKAVEMALEWDDPIVKQFCTQLLEQCRAELGV